MDLKKLGNSEIDELIHLSDDLPYFCKTSLKIITKDGSIVPLVLNRAQLHIHNILEKQRRETGKVRAVILKGRQQGCTTYTQSRYFQKIVFTPNLSAFILAHQHASTLSIFGMTSNFYKNLPKPLQFPLDSDTKQSLTTSAGSAYSVGTAGSAQVGRGMTIQLFHGSEVAFYENADQISTGLMQTVADVPGTEMIFESTANGPGNFFYNLFMGAVSGKNGFVPIFIPWYWQDEYKDPIPLKESELDEKERNYYENYCRDGLTLHHLAWRRRKIAIDPTKEWKFVQEYPFNAEEAFVKAEGRFFDMAHVYRAKGRKHVENREAPLIIGIDQGRTGDDTEIARRKGKIIYPIEKIPSDDGQERDMRLAGRVAKIIENENPDMVFIDTTNEHGAVDRLHELGYRKMVRGIHFGEAAIEFKQWRNKRAEMHGEFREWLRDPEVSIPDEQELISEIGAIPVEKETSSCLKYLVDKDSIKEELGWSPNKLDAIVLTFAYPVRKKLMGNVKESGARKENGPTKWVSKLKTLQGVRRG